MDDYSFYQAISSKKPPEKLVPVAEWGVEVLCKALPAAHRIRLEIKAADKVTNIADYTNHFYEIVCYGCYNPETGKPVFKLEQEQLFMESGDIDGTPITPLAITVLRLSKMIKNGEEVKNA